MALYETTSGFAENITTTVRPPCPRCHTAMEASEIERRRTGPGLRVGSPVAPRQRLLLWHCTNCGIRSPRLDD